MALPVRTQIRNAVTALLTGLPTTGNRVFPSRIHALAPTDLPALLIYARSEQVEYLTASRPREQARVLSLEVRGIVAATSALDDTADQINQEVDAALATDPALGGLIARMNIQTVEIAVDERAETPTASITMNIDITYTTTEGAI